MSRQKESVRELLVRSYLDGEQAKKAQQSEKHQKEFSMYVQAIRRFLQLSEQETTKLKFGEIDDRVYAAYNDVTIVPSGDMVNFATTTKCPHCKKEAIETNTFSTHIGFGRALWRVDNNRGFPSNHHVKLCPNWPDDDPIKIGISSESSPEQTPSERLMTALSGFILSIRK